MTDREMRLRYRIDAQGDRIERLQRMLADALEATADANARAEAAEALANHVRRYETEYDRVEARRRTWRESKARAYAKRRRKQQPRTVAA